MLIKKNVVFQNKLQQGEMIQYLFTDIESGYQFIIYSKDPIKSYESLPTYQPKEVEFNLELTRVYSQTDKGASKLVWKVKGVK